MVCPLTTLLYPNIYFSFVVKTCLWDVERKNVATGKFTFFFSEKHLKHHLHRIEDNPSNSSERDKYHLGTYTTKYTSTSLRFFSSMYFLSLKYHLKPLFHFYIIVLFRCYVICVSLCPPSIQWRETHFAKSKTSIKYSKQVLSSQRTKNVQANISNNVSNLWCLETMFCDFRGYKKAHQNLFHSKTICILVMLLLYKE